jgi:hypothetical protein
MMKLFQTLVFMAVMFSNIRWQWTPNGYVASLLGGLAAFFATVLLVWCGERWRAMRVRLYGEPRGRRGKQRVYQGAAPPSLRRR